MIADKTFLTESAFVAFVDYLAIKRHFTSTYDYFKYNGKTKASRDSFIARKDAYQFHLLSKTRDYKNLILSNIIIDPNTWVGDMLDKGGTDIYLDWKRRTDSITRHVQDSFSKMDDDFKKNFVSVRGQYPLIIDLYLQKQVSLEVVTIMTKMTNSSGYWNKTVLDKTVFPGILGKIDKYEPFLVYSPEKVKKIVKDHFF